MEPDGNNGEDGDGDGNFNIDDFLKEGGINIDDLSVPNTVGGRSDILSKKLEEEKKEPVYNTDPDDKMSGYLVKSSVPMDGNQEGDDIFGMMISGIGSGMKLGLKMFTDTIQIKQKKQFFAIKNGILYWYSHARARSAKNQIVIKDAKAVDKVQKSPKEFIILYKKKLYRF